MATRLRKFRLARGMSQRDLAQRAGLSRGYLLRLEGKQQDPTLSTLERLAKALGVKVTKLLE